RPNELTNLHQGCIVNCVYVGRRTRHRAQGATARAKARTDRMARVQVSDEVWASFRSGLGVTPVSIALGKLVEREVGRQRRRSANDAESARLALDDARLLTQELETLIGRLEAIAREHATRTSSRRQEPRASGNQQTPL